MIDGYEAFGLYESLKLHFTKDSYDFHKYNGKSNISVTSFENRKDKYHFYKLSRKFNKREDLTEFLVANFVERDGLWVGDLLTEDAEVNYRRRQKILQSLSYEFTGDLAKLFDGVDDPNEVIKVVDGDYPILLTYTLQKETKIETLCILNSILNFLPMWDKKITDTIRWPDFRRKIVKYTAFLPKDSVKYKLILKKVIDAKR
jgi:hypothetical protein